MNYEEQVSREMVNVHHDKLQAYLHALEAVENGYKQVARVFCSQVIEYNILYNKLRNLKRSYLE